ncbi:hypothetical protein GcM1_c11848o56 [Golovinomyces cichoracearum]|uniref:Uncharacterized protein n=1 Tax=Golovinomyces cichoracearum TaxID=62708 RepID=A0A420IEK8_9PEZI|nr:hypothetical protein GcM1_c11848o56 [Golovinomyces cichoracearum]
MKSTGLLFALALLTALLCSSLPSVAHDLLHLEASSSAKTSPKIIRDPRKGRQTCGRPGQACSGG